MDKRALTLEIDLLLKKINARHQKMMGYGTDIPEGFAELLQQEVLTLYKKYVQLEYTLQNETEHAPFQETQVQPVVQPPQVQPQLPQTSPVQPQTAVVKEEPKAEPQQEPVQQNSVPEPEAPKKEDDSIVKLVQQALSGQGEPRSNPFATPQPIVKAGPVPQAPKEPEPVKQQPVYEEPKQQVVQPPVKPVSTPAPALKNEEEIPLTLADKLRMQGIADLRKAIPIADKFLYMNELFQGEINHYNQALERFNACSNALEARDLFESMKQHFEWDENSKTVKRFADLLTRKFL
ncbi:MAG: hypothetical protein IBJ09_00135 [Bacteroidia bacterium]|nr:hypothetical protein [Bacteroidia bacterium]